MSFESRVREHWPDAADQVLGIVRGTLKPWEVDDSIEPWIDAEGIYPDHPSRRHRICDKMQAIDKLIEGYGCEAIFSDGEMWPDMEYSNQGDTYNATILFDYNDWVYRCETLGDWVEANQVTDPEEEED